MDKVKILLVEDDPNLGFVVKDNLSDKGYEVTHCINGLEAERVIYKEKFDIYLLDVMIPKKDGFTLAQELREKKDDTPIIFLTAREMQEDKLKGFSVGGDDYITKPFNFDELTMRIEAILKRTKSTTPEQKEFNIGKYILKVDELKLINGDEVSSLTKKEAALLEFLVKHVNQPVKREDMLVKIWKDDSYFAGRSMDVYITKLRKYLKDDSNIEIQNVHGVGFKLIDNKL
ncbi:MAG TPA: response regulator transcription factor [Chitinophagales bacterium]|nr:response regulator transcription factor [Chitinophagales bacterium]HMX59488.1 response regulator transcription factor [Chitinophagales bacterium]HMY22827.1 response regulator transcription factor [Chitinophagales bacterium]HMZ32779.1 response regulator transcription factor [Chitinophagales bacterium]HNA38167.1 response regulator transcription factor [Chitinophagales bacterium]